MKNEAHIDEPGLFFRILQFVLPKANVNEKYIKHIKYWAVEINENGTAEREIGFDVDGNPIFFAPSDDDLGVWTDSNRVFNKNEFEHFDFKRFDGLWNSKFCE